MVGDPFALSRALGQARRERVQAGLCVSCQDVPQPMVRMVRGENGYSFPVCGACLDIWNEWNSYP